MSSLDFDFDNDLAKFTPRQKQAIAALDNPLFKYLLYGGALGGGKSYLLRWAAARTLMVASSEFGVKAPVGMLACEDYPALKDRITSYNVCYTKLLRVYVNVNTGANPCRRATAIHHQSTFTDVNTCRVSSS